MADLTLRGVKGSPLTNQEVDNNFTSLNNAKYESGDSPSFADVTLAGMAGAIAWNLDDATVDIPLNSSVTLQVGQEFVFYGKSTEIINNGDVVMFAGAQGGHVLVSRCNMSAPGFDPTWVVGVATQDFAANDFGYITSTGKVRGLDTSMFAEGTVLYVNPLVAGGVTATKPVAPYQAIQIAAVLNSHAQQGTLMVRATHLPDTDEIAEGQTNKYFTNARAITAIQGDPSWKASTWDTAYSWGDHATFGYATTTYVDAAVSSLVDAAPGTLDTLNELAAALGDDPNFATTVTNSLAGKVSKSGDTISGTVSITSGSQINHNFETSASVATYRSDAPYWRLWQPSSGTQIVSFNNGHVGLSYDGVEKLATRPTGAEVSGEVVANTSENAWGFRAETAGGVNDSGIWFTGTTARLLLRDGTGTIKTMLAANGTNAENVINGNTIWHAGNDGVGSGLDADLLDGQQGSYYAPASSLNNYILKTSFETLNYYSGDVNAITRPGFYFANSTSTNKPNNGVIIHGGYTTSSTSYDSQILVSHATDGMYFRSKDAGVWESWKRTFADNYHPNADKWTTARTHTVTLVGDVTGTASQSVDGTGDKTWTITTSVVNDSHEHDTRYVLKTGDTMTGDLTAPNFNLTAGTQFRGYNGSYTQHKSTATNVGGIRFVDGTDALKGYLYWEGAGHIGLLRGGSWAVKADATNYIGLFGSTRSPVYYDMDNTAYYINAASGSYLYQLTTEGSMYVNGDNNRLRVGSGGAGKSVTIGNRATSDGTALDYAGYVAYDCSFNGTNWVADRTTLSRKWMTQIGGFHNSSFNVNFFGGDPSQPWAHSAWTRVFTVGETGEGTFAGPLNTTLIKHTNGNTAIELNEPNYLILNNKGGSRRMYFGTNDVYLDSNTHHYRTSSAGEFATANSSAWVHTSSMRTPIFYDYNDTNFYADFASTSNLNILNVATINRDPTITLSGDVTGSATMTNLGSINIVSDINISKSDGFTGTYPIAWLSSDNLYSCTWMVVDGANDRIFVPRVDASSQMRAPIFYDSGNTAYYWNPNDSSAHRFNTANGYIHIGPMNSSHCHISTDRSNFYFNTELVVNSGIIGSYDEDTYLRRARNAAHQIQIGAGTTTISQNTVIQGTLTVDGVNYPDGFGQIISFTTNQALSTAWADIPAIAGGVLASGSWMVQVHVYNHDAAPSGGNYDEYYTGVMSWYGGDTNDNDTNEIALHNAGHAFNGPAIYLRTARRFTGNGGMILQIAASGSVGADDITIKFRRLI